LGPKAVHSLVAFEATRAEDVNSASSLLTEPLLAVKETTQEFLLYFLVVSFVHHKRRQGGVIGTFFKCLAVK